MWTNVQGLLKDTPRIHTLEVCIQKILAWPCSNVFLKQLESCWPGNHGSYRNQQVRAMAVLSTWFIHCHFIPARKHAKIIANLGRKITSMPYQNHLYVLLMFSWVNQTASHSSPDILSSWLKNVFSGWDQMWHWLHLWDIHHWLGAKTDSQVSSFLPASCPRWVLLLT